MYCIIRIIELLKKIMKQFAEWKKNLIINDNIMGGEAVFPNSRLSVRHIGGMLEKGESYEVILEDYPYLSLEDLKFAEIYVKTYPQVEDEEAFSQALEILLSGKTDTFKYPQPSEMNYREIEIMFQKKIYK